MNNKDLHRLLKRQIKKSGLSKIKSAELSSFLELVDEAYKDFDKDLSRIEHILEESSQELFKLNQALKLERDTTNDRLENIVNNVNGVIFQTDLKGRLIYINRAWTELTGIPIEEALNKNFRNFLFKGNLKEKKKFLQLIEGSLSKYQTVFRYIDPSKNEKWIKITLAFINSNTGEIEGTIGTLTDVTSIKRTEIKLQKANKAKDDFLSAMSHDIRTPLNAVIGISNILLIDKHLPHQVENLNGLKFSSEHLLGLVNNILDFNKIKSGKILLEEKEFSLDYLLNSLKMNFKFQAEEKNIQFDIKRGNDIPPTLVGDILRLSQILNNLLSNAFKFTEEGSITLTIVNLIQDKNKVNLYFEVTDTGIGIDPSRQKFIFNSFEQAELETTRKYGGSGLGLAICKRLLKMQNSDIDVVSELGKGSSFRFNMEFIISDNICENIPALIQGQTTFTPLKLKVLVAEDNQMNVLVLEKFLNHWNVEFEIAGNGKEMLQIYDTKDFDLILMDLQMPVMDGYEATKRIRSLANKQKAEIHVIAVTASAQIEVKEKAEKYKMNGFLSKPINPTALYKLLEYYSNNLASYSKID